MKKYIAGILLLVVSTATSQVKWINVDSAFEPLPQNFHVYKTTDSLDGKPFIAYYAEAKLKDRDLDFTVDTSKGRRLTPIKFYEKNAHPLLVVNSTFFSYETNKAINVVIKEGDMVFYNTHTIPMKGKDTFQYRHPFGSAIGINKKRQADIAWLLTDSSKKYPYASQWEIPALKDSATGHDRAYYLYATAVGVHAMSPAFTKWKMKTAVGGGPVLVQNNEIKITNEEELRFNGKAINDKHPRTCMGYTNDGRLIIMVIQGRFPGIAEGATLTQQAKLLVDLGCKEALNLDGGGSSCMLINGKETIKPCDKEGERPVPAVFIIK
jgi:hypothetical protein